MQAELAGTGQGTSERVDLRTGDDIVLGGKANDERRLTEGEDATSITDHLRLRDASRVANRDWWMGR